MNRTPTQHHRRRGRIESMLLLAIGLALGVLTTGVVLVVLWQSGWRPPGAGPESGALSPQQRAQAPRLATAAERQTITVFHTRDGMQLHPLVLEMPHALQPAERLHTAIRELLEEPLVGEMRRTVPTETGLNTTFLDGNTAVIDLDSGLTASTLGGPLAELLCAQAIALTAAENLPGIANVRILVDGQETDILWDQVDLSAPLRPDPSLIAR